MSEQSPLKRPLRAQHARPLGGRFIPGGDREVSHLALLCAAAATGLSRLSGLSAADDVAATARLIESMGARLVSQDGEVFIAGLGGGALLEPTGPVEVASATGATLAMGFCGTRPFETQFVTADMALARTSFGDILELLGEAGTAVLEQTVGKLPLTLRGPRTPLPLEIRVPRASSRAKGALLLSALGTPGISRVVEPALSRDHVEAMLFAFEADVTERFEEDGAHAVEIAGLPDLRAQALAIPGDPSAAGLATVAALLIGGSELTMEGVLLNPTRVGLIETLIEMGGDIVVANKRRWGGEEVGDIVVRHSQLQATSIPAARTALLDDDLPTLAVAAAFANGETVVGGIAEQRARHPARLEAILPGLESNGVWCAAGEDELTIAGKGRVTGGGFVRAGGDHRVAMAFAVMGMASRDAVLVDDVTNVEPHFPGIIAQFEALGVRFGKDGWK